MQAAVLVALGGAVGSVLRYWGQLGVERWVGVAFPWAILSINALGSFVIGIFAALTAGQGRLAGSSETRLLVMVGLCGGFTTFSSFSLQTVTLLRAGETGLALANIAASVAICLVATTAGLMLFTRG